MTETAQLKRNAGPSWGFQFLTRAQQVTPRWLLRPALGLGTWVAVARMPAQRRYSREYLSVVFGRPARLMEVWRHFFCFLELLLLRLRVAHGAPFHGALAPTSSPDFEQLIQSQEPALFGTFHFGHSDLLGFLLTTRGRKVSMVRLRIGNSPDMEQFAQQFAGSVSFVWVNEPENLLFTLKSSIEGGASLALHCDRAEFTAKTEAFEFLGARREFPFTIYHLATIFRRPVMFCIGLPDETVGTRVHALPLFRPEGSNRTEMLQHARVHFQLVLRELETLVRQHPMLWFNFLPLNPEVPAGASR